MVLRACVRTTELELALTTFSSSDHDASASANCFFSSCSLILAATLLHCCRPFSSTRDTWYSNGPHDNCNRAPINIFTDSSSLSKKVVVTLVH